MHFARGATSKSPDDATRLALFGSPVFGFVPQPRIQERGWSWYANHGQTLEAQAHYWLADPTGNFWFEDSPAGPVGIAELRGFVFTDFTGTTMALAGRVLTVVIHTHDVGKIDTRLTRRH